MKPFRPQFTARTLLAITAACAVGASLWKCEHDAEVEYSVKTAAVQSALQSVLRDRDWALWEKSAQTENGQFPQWVRDVLKSHKREARVDLDFKPTVNETTASDYFGSMHRWHTVGEEVGLTEAECKQTPAKRIDATITCSRSCSTVSRITSVHVTAGVAPDNKLFLDRLKSELDRSNVRYEIDDNPSTATGR